MCSQIFIPLGCASIPEVPDHAPQVVVGSFSHRHLQVHNRVGLVYLLLLDRQFILRFPSEVAGADLDELLPELLGAIVDNVCGQVHSPLVLRIRLLDYIDRIARAAQPIVANDRLFDTLHRIRRQRPCIKGDLLVAS